MMEAAAAFQVLSLNEYEPQIRDYKKRKLHKKTRSGCLTCRTKRVKVRFEVERIEALKLTSEVRRKQANMLTMRKKQMELFLSSVDQFRQRCSSIEPYN